LPAAPAALRRRGGRLGQGLRLDLARDVVLVSFEGGRERLYSRRMACVRCDISVPELSPRAFSFNSGYGACPSCDGLGLRWAVDPAKVEATVKDGILELRLPKATEGKKLKVAPSVN